MGMQANFRYEQIRRYDYMNCSKKSPRFLLRPFGVESESHILLLMMIIEQVSPSCIVLDLSLLT